MLIDRSHKNWAVFTLVALAAATGYFTVYYRGSYLNGGNGPAGSSWPGLAYGIVGFVLMIFCGLLGIRRKVRVWRLGSGQGWLRAHIWLGLLAFPLILFHAGLVFGHGLTLWLMILFSVVLVSGILGVVLQNILPRTMLVRVQAETTYEQIPQVIESLRREADQLVANVCGPLGNEMPVKEGDVLPGGGGHGMMKREGAVQGKVIKAKAKSVGVIEGSAPLKSFYMSEVQPFLQHDITRATRLGVQRSALALFEHTCTLLPDTLHETLKDLESVCEERRQLALQVRLHHWLHCWEYLHIPISYALLVLSAVHAVKATFWY